MSGAPLARPSAWRLWWSFTWRQAVVMVLSTLGIGFALSLLKLAGFPPGLLYGATPYLTFAVVLYSGYEACRRLMSVYDIRRPGAHADEQDHRHRR